MFIIGLMKDIAFLGRDSFWTPQSQLPPRPVNIAEASALLLLLSGRSASVYRTLEPFGWWSIVWSSGAWCRLNPRFQSIFLFFSPQTKPPRFSPLNSSVHPAPAHYKFSNHFSPSKRDHVPTPKHPVQPAPFPDWSVSMSPGLSPHVVPIKMAKIVYFLTVTAITAEKLVLEYILVVIQHDQPYLPSNPHILVGILLSRVDL